MTPELFAKAFIDVFPPLWSIAWKALFFIIIIYVFKHLGESLASYLMFKSLKKIGCNVRVKVNDRDAYITEYNWRWIYLRTQGGNELLIPMKKWHTYQWELVDYYAELYQKPGDVEECEKCGGED